MRCTQKCCVKSFVNGAQQAATKTAALYDNGNEDENSLRLYDNEDT